MGGLNVNTKLDLNCLIHGEYKKFITDENKSCPHCMSEDARKAEQEQLSKTLIKSHVKIIKVSVNCSEHGVSEFDVPEFMAKLANECPHCAKVNRINDVKPFVKKAIELEYKESGIPENYLDQRFSTIDASKSPKQQAISGRLIEYVKDLAVKGASFGAKNILLSGNMGTGKTLYASILLKEVLNRSLVRGVTDEKDIRLKGQLSVLFISEPVLLNEITATWKSNTENSKSLMSRLASKSILCIDDVGAITSTHAHLIDFYASLIDERYKRRLPTIITSNLPYDDLKLAIGARSADRFMEKNRIIIANFDWNGYRSGELGTDEIEMF